MKTSTIIRISCFIAILQAHTANSDCAVGTGEYVVVNVEWNDPIGGLAIRATPDKDAVIKGIIPPTGTGIMVEACRPTGWCKVHYECVDGWSLRTGYLAPRSQQLFRVIKVDPNDPEGLNLRTGPGGEFPRITGIPYNSTDVIVHYCNTNNSWCLVTYGKESGWSSQQFLATIDDAPSNPELTPEHSAATIASSTLLSPISLIEKRVALVIGEASYQNLRKLDNPKNDAKLVADTLRSLGFKLVGDSAQLDLGKAGIDRVVQQFGVAMQNADVGLFYFAGHGVEVHGSNYLVPVDADPTREADVDFQMLDANLVLRQMTDSKAKLNFILLDACRNNPFEGRGFRAINSGLAEMQAPEGTLISFATKPGAVASDGKDGHSPYTEALAKEMRIPGVDVFRAFNEVGLAVMDATKGEQQPWVSYSPIKGVFYFAGSSANGKKDP